MCVCVNKSIFISVWAVIPCLRRIIFPFTEVSDIHYPIANIYFSLNPHEKREKGRERQAGRQTDRQKEKSP